MIFIHKRGEERQVQSKSGPVMTGQWKNVCRCESSARTGILNSSLRTTTHKLWIKQSKQNREYFLIS